MPPAPFACPRCHAALKRTGDAKLTCAGCGRDYAISGDVPVLIVRDESSGSGGQQFDHLVHYQRDNAAFDYFAPRTGATGHSERRLREFIVSRIRNSVTAILDIGCGSGWVAGHYHQRGVAICSLDASPVNPQKALDRYPSPDHVGVAADAFALPFADASIECIIAAEIIEHVPEPQGLLAEMFRVLRPGGMIVVSTPYKEKIVYELCIHCGQLTPRNAHLHSFDEHEFAGFVAGHAGVAMAWWAINDKFLIFSRSHVLLRFLPFTLWRVLDWCANRIVRKPANLVAVFRKS